MKDTSSPLSDGDGDIISILAEGTAFGPVIISGTLTSKDQSSSLSLTLRKMVCSPVDISSALLLNTARSESFPSRLDRQW